MYRDSPRLVVGRDMDDCDLTEMWVIESHMWSSSEFIENVGIDYYVSEEHGINNKSSLPPKEKYVKSKMNWDDVPNEVKNMFVEELEVMTDAILDVMGDMDD